MIAALLLLLAALGLVVVCGVFVAAEFALLAVDRPTVARLAADGSRSAKGTLFALSTLSTQLSGVQVAITLTNLAIGLLAEPALATLLEGPLESIGLEGEAVPAVAVGIGLIVSTLLTMLVGELLPKNLAIAKPVEVAAAVQAPVRAFTRAIAWPIRWLNGLAEGTLRRFGVEPKEELSSARSAEELLAVVRRSAEQGALEGGEARLLARSLVFGRRRAVDAMTPRVRVQNLTRTASVDDLIALSSTTGLSRFPVVGRTVDEVLGIAEVKAVLAVPRADRARTTITSVMGPPVLVPATLPLDELLERLRGRQSQLAIVVDEYGGTDGVITLEDLVEELVGEVEDEFDSARARGVVADGDGWLVPADLAPGAAAETTGLRIPNGSWATVAGLFLEHAHDLPDVGDSVVVEGTTWTAVEIDGHRIITLRAEPGVDDDA